MLTEYSLSLLRLRHEVSKLVVRHAGQGSDMVGKAKIQTKFYGLILQGLSVRSCWFLETQKLTP